MALSASTVRVGIVQLGSLHKAPTTSASSARWVKSSPPMELVITNRRIRNRTAPGGGSGNAGKHRRRTLETARQNCVLPSNAVVSEWHNHPTSLWGSGGDAFASAPASARPSPPWCCLSPNRAGMVSLPCSKGQKAWLPQRSTTPPPQKNGMKWSY